MSEEIKQDEVLGLVHEIKTEIDANGKDTAEQMSKLTDMVVDLQEKQAELAEEKATRQAELDNAEAEKATGFKAFVEGGKYDGTPSSHLIIAAHMIKGSAKRMGQSFDSMASEDLRKALTSTGNGSGDQWVPTGMANQLYSEWEKQSIVWGQYYNQKMPTNPFEMPIVTTAPEVYLNSTEATSTTESSPGSGKITFTAKKLMAETDYSYEAGEDAIIAVAPLVQAQLSKAMSAALDSVALNGDTTTGSANINSYGSGAVSASISTGSKYLAFDGLIYQGLVTNTACKADISGLAIGDFTTLMGKMGKYATRPGENRFYMDIWTYLAALGVTGFVAVSDYGPSATVLNGELGKIFGIPVVVTEEIAKANSAGLVSQTAGDNTLGRIVLNHVPSWITGSKREVMIETDRNIQTQQEMVVISTRVDMQQSGTASTNTNTAVGYDVVV